MSSLSFFVRCDAEGIVEASRRKLVVAETMPLDAQIGARPDVLALRVALALPVAMRRSPECIAVGLLGGYSCCALDLVCPAPIATNLVLNL